MSFTAFLTPGLMCAPSVRANSARPAAVSDHVAERDRAAAQMRTIVFDWKVDSQAQGSLGGRQSRNAPLADPGRHAIGFTPG